MQHADPAPIIWFTGLSGSGKTTLSTKLADHLKEQGTVLERLDGDQVRSFFEGDLGYTPDERRLNVRRITFAAYLLAKHSTTVLVANIAPYYDVRDFIREKLKDSYIQVYVKTSLQEVQSRDVKGHYQNFKDEKEKNLIGVDDVYDIPRNPDLVLNTEEETEEESFAKLLSYLNERGVC